MTKKEKAAEMLTTSEIFELEDLLTRVAEASKTLAKASRLLPTHEAMAEAQRRDRQLKTFQRREAALQAEIDRLALLVGQEKRLSAQLEASRRREAKLNAELTSIAEQLNEERRSAMMVRTMYRDARRELIALKPNGSAA